MVVRHTYKHSFVISLLLIFTLQNVFAQNTPPDTTSVSETETGERRLFWSEDFSDPQGDWHLYREEQNGSTIEIVNDVLRINYPDGAIGSNLQTRPGNTDWRKAPVVGEEPYEIEWQIEPSFCDSRDCSISLLFNVGENYTPSSQVNYNPFSGFWGIYRDTDAPNVRFKTYDEVDLLEPVNVFDGSPHTMNLLLEEDAFVLTIDGIEHVRTPWDGYLGGTIGLGVRDSGSNRNTIRTQLNASSVSIYVFSPEPDPSALQPYFDATVAACSQLQRNSYMVRFNTDKTILAAATQDGAYIYTYPDMQPVALLRETAYSVAWADSGDKLAVGSSSGTLFDWDLATGETRQYNGHTGPVMDVAWVNDDAELLSAANDGARRWLVGAVGQATETYTEVETFGDTAAARYIIRQPYIDEFTPEMAVVSFANGEARRVEITRDNVNSIGNGGSFDYPSPYFIDWGFNMTTAVEVLAGRPSNDGRRLVTFYDERISGEVDYSPGFFSAVAFEKTAPEGTTTAHISPTDNVVAVVAGDKILFYDNTGIELGRVTTERGEYLPAIWMGETRLLTFTDNGCLTEVDTTTGEVLSTVGLADLDASGVDETLDALTGKSSGDTAAASDPVIIRPDVFEPSWAITGGATRRLATLYGRNFVGNMAFSPDGRYLVGGSSQIEVWDLMEAAEPGAKLIARLDEDADYLLFTPDGTGLIYRNNRFVVWDIESQIVRVEINPEMRYEDVLVTPDGKYLVTGGRVDQNGMVRLFDIETSDMVHEFDVPEEVATIAVSNNGRYLAAGTDRGTIIVWDIPTRTALMSAVMTQPRSFNSGGWMNSVGFTADNTRVIGLSDDTLEAWDITTAAQTMSREVPQSAILDPLVVNPVLNQVAIRLDRNVLVVDVDTGRDAFAYQYKQQIRGIRALTYSQDGTRLIISWGSTRPDGDHLIVMDATTGAELADINNPDQPATARDWAAIHPGGSLAAFKSGESEIWLVALGSAAAGGSGDVTTSAPAPTSAPDATEAPTLIPLSTVMPSVTPTLIPTTMPTLAPPTPTQVVIVSCPGLLTSRLIPGEHAQVVLGLGSNRLRTQPALSGQQVTMIPEGGQFDVLDGPVCADGYAWYQVNYAGQIGWTAESGDGKYWLAPRN